ncbi:hypothetical protein D3C71_1645240 [compost metagenome]
MCALTSFVVYWESVVLLGTSSSTLAKLSERGAKYSRDRPATIGAARVVLEYELVITICAEVGLITAFPDGITAWHDRLNSRRSLLN